MGSRCRWVYDKDVPTGKFLVPGCWNRAVHGDDAECQCVERPETIGDQLAALRRDLADLAKTVKGMRAPDQREGGRDG